MLGLGLGLIRARSGASHNVPRVDPFTGPRRRQAPSVAGGHRRPDTRGMPRCPWHPRCVCSCADDEATICAGTSRGLGSHLDVTRAKRSGGHGRVGNSLRSVTVKAWLSGHEFDLRDLADMLPRGETCVINEDGEYYLSSVEVDDRPDGVPFYEVAPRVLRRVNGLGRSETRLMSRSR